MQLILKYFLFNLHLLWLVLKASFRGQNLGFQLLSWQKVQKSFCMYMYTDNCFQIVYSNCALHHSGDISILLLFLWYHSFHNLNKEAWTVSLSYNDLDLPPGLRTGLFISRHNDPDIHRQWIKQPFQVYLCLLE